jgi:hypothetical protein
MNRFTEFVFIAAGSKTAAAGRVGKTEANGIVNSGEAAAVVRMTRRGD